MNAELEHFLKELKKHVTVKEPTLFAVGGRGYYENPASDLLAFFLNPKREHRLGDLFLTTYLECMGADNPQLNTKIDVEVRSQVQTSKGKFIDLQILGLDWCLIIENKINHWDTNPFTDYERHANGLGKEKKHLSILSRDGHPYDNKDSGTRWVGVSYQDYCKALRERMAAIFFDRPFSKWQIFAREFILHLENELYNPPMTKEQAADVEKYSNQIAEAEKLAKQYREFIYQELKLLLEKKCLRKYHHTRRYNMGWLLVGFPLRFFPMGQQPNSSIQTGRRRQEVCDSSLSGESVRAAVIRRKACASTHEGARERILGLAYGL